MHLRPRAAASVLLLALAACSSPALDQGEQLTPEELEYQRSLASTQRRDLDAGGRARLILELDQNLLDWHRAQSESLGSRDRDLVDNWEQVLQIKVYHHVEDLLIVLREGDPAQRAIAAGALGFCRLEEPEEPAARARFRESWPPVHARVVPPLVGLLDEPDPALVGNALISLWKIGDRSTPQAPILDHLTDPEEEVRANAALALSTILDPDNAAAAVPELLSASYDTDAKVRNHVVNAMRAARFRSTSARLAQLLQDPYLLIQANAARALGEIGDPKSVEPLLRRLEELLKMEREENAFRELTDLDKRRANVARYVVGALERITGEPLGDDIEAWRGWWIAEGKPREGARS